MEHLILREMRSILEYGVSDPRIEASFNYLAKCLDPETPSYEISMKTLEWPAAVLPQFSKSEEKALEMINQVKDILYGKGYREGFRTRQEHKLFGSSFEKDPFKNSYEEEPFKPIGLIDGRIESIEEAQKARDLTIFMKGDKLLNFLMPEGELFIIDDSKFYVPVFLERLDRNGNTERHPRLMGKDMKPIETEYPNNFPFLNERLLLK